MKFGTRTALKVEMNLILFCIGKILI